MGNGKKVVFSLAIKGYPPQMSDLTLPWIKHYAKKIGAEFMLIEERKHPEWPITAEKLQIWELGKGNDWNVFVDIDALINPELFDVTALCPRDHVMFTGQDMSAMREAPTPYRLRDGRYIGACTWFVVSSDWTHDLWFPPWLWPDHNTPQEWISEIFPTNAERMCRIGKGDNGITPEKLIEDHILGENIARFGLKHTTIEGHVKPTFGRRDSFYHHMYTQIVDQKIMNTIGVMLNWGLLDDMELRKKYDLQIRKIQREIHAAEQQQPTNPMLRILQERMRMQIEE